MVDGTVDLPLSDRPLAHTPLYDAHVALGARMVPFAGYLMPVQYTGLMEEHHAVRRAAGLFDVSHMGEFFFRGAGALATLEHLVPTNVSRLRVGDALYSALMNDAGGIVDDVIVYRIADTEYLMVVNASNRAKDAAWCEAHLLPGCAFEDASDAYGLIALQGPRAREILRHVCDADVAALGSFQHLAASVAGVPCRVSTTGYTGEDGVEVMTPAARTAPVWHALMEAGAPAGVRPIGLGARDSLRTEMKFSLYGNDIDDTTSPLEASLGWIVKLDKGPFIGRDVLVRQKAEGLSRKLVGFEMVDAGIPRHGYPLTLEGAPVGVVTSGTHSPTLGRPIGIGYVPPAHAHVGAELDVDIRGKARRARVCKTPFYQRPA